MLSAILNHAGKLVVSGLALAFVLPVIYGVLIRLPDVARRIIKLVKE